MLTRIHTKARRLKMNWKKTDILALMVGHGRSLDGTWDSGCVYGDYTEAGLMLKIVKVAVKWLRKSGVKVITDADDANNRNMTASVAWANMKGAKRYIAAHCNYSLGQSGVFAIYASEEGKVMADTICDSIAKAMKLKRLKDSRDPQKFEVNSTKMPAIILESAAIKRDIKKLKDYKKFGKALAKAICKYIGVALYVSRPVKVRRAVLAVVKKEKALKFKYKVSGNAMSWAVAKLKQRTTNCSRTISYGLQVAKILKAGQIFWLNGTKIVCQGKGTRTRLLKYYDVLHPKKTTKSLVKSKKLKAGDIVGYGDPAHTMMFAGYDALGCAKWYSTGNQKALNKGKAHIESKYDNRKIMTLLRLK